MMAVTDKISEHKKVSSQQILKEEWMNKWYGMDGWVRRTSLLTVFVLLTYFKVPLGVISRLRQHKALIIQHYNEQRCMSMYTSKRKLIKLKWWWRRGGELFIAFDGRVGRIYELISIQLFKFSAQAFYNKNKPLFCQISLFLTLLFILWA